jgi:DNA polymerase, archaea type
MIRGSALKSQGIEPFLSELTKVLIQSLLGASQEDPLVALARQRAQITAGEASVRMLAKSETLNQSPAKYQKEVEGSNKPRRAALEVALRMDPCAWHG